MGARKLVTLVLIAVAVVLTARYLFWNDRRDVRRRLYDIADAAGGSSAELGTFVTDDVIIRTDAASFVGGRPAVVRLVHDAAAAHRQMRVSLDDVQVELIDAATATAFFTLNIFSGGSSAPDTASRQVHATLIKQQGEWLLTRGEVLRTLEGR
jgi:ketosteroid isomerase-like protein